MDPEQKTNNGALIGSIIIIVILIIGGIYLWKAGTKENPAPLSNTEGNETVNQQDNTNSIETDLNDINLDNLDQNI